MRAPNSRRLVAATAWIPLFVLHPIVAPAQLTFQTVPASGDLASVVSVTALSKDGSALAGEGWSLTNWGPKAFVWTLGAGTRQLDVPSANSSSASSVNSNGTVVAGWCFKADGGAFIWKSGSFGSVTQNYGAIIRAVSSDGSIAVGANPTNRGSGVGVAAQWTVSNGTVTSLGGLTGAGAESDAVAISGDNSTVVGWGKSANGLEAFRRRGGNMTGLGDLAGGKFFSQAAAVSRDGNVVVGRSDSTNGMQAFRWTSTNGMVGLGDLPGGANFSEATSVSGDGTIIVGASDSAAGTEPFVWDSDHGLRSLAALTGASGVDLAGWRFPLCKPVISEDGNVVAGRGFDPDYQPVVWRLSGLRSVLDRQPSPAVALRPSGNRFALRFVAEAGFRYQVQRTTQLGASAVWENTGVPTLGDGIEHEVSFDKAGAACFWRLVVSQASP